MPFQKGNKFAKGGARPGAGRKPSWFHQYIQKRATDPKTFLRLDKILADKEDAEDMITKDGECIPIRAKADTYMRALEFVTSYHQGRPRQEIEHSGEMGISIVDLIHRLEQERGLKETDF